MVGVQNGIVWAKQLNLFKSADDSTAHAIRKQLIITRTYLILLSSMLIYIAKVFAN